MPRKAIATLDAWLLAGCMMATLCGHAVTDAAEPASADVTVPVAAAQFREVTVGFASLNKGRILAEPAFDAEVMRTTVTETLRSLQRFDSSANATGQILEILVDDLTVEPSSNLVLFGQVASTATLIGLARVLDARGVEIRSVKIVAESQVRVKKEGRDPKALQKLYRRFAEKAAATL
jgi:hypothetical protein